MDHYPPADLSELTQLIVTTLTTIAPEADSACLDPVRAFRDQIELDSVDFLNFVLTLEKRLERPIPASHYPRLSSLKGCLEYLSTGAPAPVTSKGPE
jgi:acyl carrier protein